MDDLTVVDHRRQTGLVVHGGGGPGRGEDVMEHLLEEGRQIGPPLVAGAAHGAAQFHHGGDDVVYRPTPDGPEHYGHRLEVVPGALDGSGEVGEDLARGPEQVDGLVGSGGVAPRSLQDDVEPIGGSGDRPDSAPHVTRGDGGVDVEADYRGETIYPTLLDNLDGSPGKGFLRRLEHETHPTGQLGESSHHQGDTHTDGGMEIVATGVHHSGDLRGEGTILGFLDGEGIDVGPEANGSAARSDIGE